MPHTTRRNPDHAQEDSESDPSSGHDLSPDYSDTDSSSGEATITAGPTGKGNLIGRATIAAARNTTGNGGRHGENEVISESEYETDDSRLRGVEGQPANRIPPSTTTSANLKRSLSNPAGWANQVYQERRSDAHVTSGGHVQAAWGKAWHSHQRQSSAGGRASGSWLPAAESSKIQEGLTNAEPSKAASTSGTTPQYRYPGTSTSAFGVPLSSVPRSTYPNQKGEHTQSRPKPATTTAASTSGSASANQSNGNPEKRSSVNRPTVSRTASLPRMPRFQGFSPIVAMSTLANVPAPDALTTGHRPNMPASGAKYAVEDDTSDQDGIYMNDVHSRRKRSLQRRRKAASDGSRTPVSPALSLSPLVSPALSSVSSSLDSSPISYILGHASSKQPHHTALAENPYNYAARTELRKRRGSQQNTQQAPTHITQPSYAYHVAPRLAHQPRSDFSIASTSEGSAGVSSGYTASADSGDSRSNASQSSSGALGLSLGEASSTDDGRRRHTTSTQDPAHRRLLSDEGTWDGIYTDTLQSPSPILSAFETDVPAMSLPPSAIGLAQSSRFPLLIFLLRLLAVVPATIGALSLMWDAIFPAPATLGLVGHSAGDKLMSLPWTALTGMFCFELTTGLTHRWLLYYSLAPTLLRLVSLQSICWPSTFITLRYLGNIDILFAWIVVATTTACSRSVQIWVTSNVPEISARTLKPAAIALASGSKDPRGGKDTLDPRSRESYEKSRRKSRQAAHVLLRERYWDWNYIIGAVWIRVGILYIVTTAYLICHRHL